MPIDTEHVNNWENYADLAEERRQEQLEFERMQEAYFREEEQRMMEAQQRAEDKEKYPLFFIKPGIVKWYV